LNHRSPPRILVLTSSYPSDSSDETCGYVRELAHALAESFEVTVLAPCDATAETVSGQVDVIRSRSVLPVRFNPFRASVDFNSLRSQPWYRRAAALPAVIAYAALAFKLSLSADVICTNWLVPCGLLGAAISAILRKPHVAIEHSGALHLLRRMTSGKRLSSFIVKHSQAIIVVSADLKSKMIDLCPGASAKVEVIPMGIARETDCLRSERLAAASPRNRVLLCLGRLTEIKGGDVLIRAASMLNNVQVIFAGEGDQEQRLKWLAASFSVEARFTGRVDRAVRNDLFAASDLVVIPSRRLADGRTEGTPVVCLEAMAAGKPIIASNVGGLPEIIQHRVNGMLAEPDDAHDFASRISEVLDDPVLAGRLSRNATSTAERYYWSVTGERFRKAISAALRGAPAATGRRERFDANQSHSDAISLNSTGD